MVTAGDTLPQLCYKIYGDPRYYLQVADRNTISNFRTLSPGDRIVFPPIAKTLSAGATT
jgi:nucleoid-associated protein YgaU